MDDETQKIVINACHGGFGLSHEAVLRYARLKGLRLYIDNSKDFADVLGPDYWLVPFDGRPEPQDNWHSWSIEQRQESNAAHDRAKLTPHKIERDDPTLAQVVEDLGRAANGPFSNLQVVEIPADVEWTIEEYDGLEWVAEKHRTWP